MPRKIIIVLTEFEAAQLMLVAGNGYGDGDFYQGFPDGQRRKQSAYLRAIYKLNEARHKKGA